jgi:hypothetical protein
MNSDTGLAAEECAKEAGALISCPVCHDCLISAGDPDADRIAYAIATNARKEGRRGFHGMDREEVMSIMKKMLENSSACSRCSSMRNG